MEYHAIAKKELIDDEIIFAEADGYPVEIVQPKITINELEMKGGVTCRRLQKYLPCSQTAENPKV